MKLLQNSRKVWIRECIDPNNRYPCKLKYYVTLFSCLYFIQEFSVFALYISDQNQISKLWCPLFSNYYSKHIYNHVCTRISSGTLVPIVLVQVNFRNTKMQVSIVLMGTYNPLLCLKSDREQYSPHFWSFLGTHQLLVL